MRIAIINEHWGAGAARCARDLQTQLMARHDVEFFPREQRETVASLMQRLIEYDPEVVNCHSFYGFLPYAALAEISSRFPTCFTVHDPRPIGTMEMACWTCDRNDTCLRCPLIPGRLGKVFKNPYLWKRMEKRRTHQRCSPDMVVVAPSEWMANRLREQELKRFKVRTVRNGIDATLFSPCESDRRKFGLPLDVPVILHSAWRAGDWEINHRKGLMHLSEAFVKHVLPRFPHAVLAVAGESIAPNHPNVKPLGIINQEQLPSLLGSVDVFVTSTLADNLPYTILEAMGCAKAVIASRVGGIPEQVVDGETGLLVEAGNIFELGHAIIQQFSDPERTRLYGLAGRERVKKLFGIKQFVGGYEDIFIQLATSRSRPVSDFRPH